MYNVYNYIHIASYCIILHNQIVYLEDMIAMYMGLEWFDQTFSNILTPQMDAIHWAAGHKPLHITNRTPKKIRSKYHRSAASRTKICWNILGFHMFFVFKKSICLDF